MDTVVTSPQDAAFVPHLSPGRFDGTTIIVTGAGSGIGRATALRAAREGARVIATDMNTQRLADLVDMHPGLALVPVTADVSSTDGVAEVIAAAGARIDGLANIAGIMDHFQPAGEVTDEIWDRVMAVNVTAVMRMTRAVIPVMLAAGTGAIVNVASEAGIRGSSAGVAYTASKHAVIGITRSCAVMYARSGLRCNALMPGGVHTNIEAPFESTLGAQVVGSLIAATMPPMAEPDEIAAPLCYLLSADAPNITGALLACDSGWSAI